MKIDLVEFSRCTPWFIFVYVNKMKTKMNFTTIVMKLMFGAFKWYMTLFMYINSFLLLHSLYYVSVKLETEMAYANGIE